MESQTATHKDSLAQKLFGPGYHVWHEFNFWLVTFTAIYSLISLFALWVAIRSARQAKQSADASVATVRAWLDTHSFKFIYSPPGAREQLAPQFSLTIENLGRTPAKDLSMTVGFVFEDQPTDKQFSGCPETNSNQVPFMVAGPPGEPWTVAVGTVPAADFAKLKPGGTASVYAHGCVHYHDVMTDQVRLTEFCVRYSGGNQYMMCDNANLMD
jgi:hypothetical protein